MKLEGRVAIVTGASRGIGKAIAEAFSEEGASVVCTSTAQGGCDETLSNCRAGSMSLVCDVSDVSSVEAMVSETLSNYGQIDILVNNAGATRDQLILRMDDDEWDDVLAINLTGAFYCIRSVARTMMKARYGRIINMTSIVGLHGGAGQVNYAAAKAGLVGLTKSVAKEFGSRGITCNAIAPGFIETDMTKKLPQEMRNHVEQTAPLGRLGVANDVSSVAVFLASDSSSYITGQVLVVDGGLTL
jgi:3-oxoacyl-[acyl-carrier protein] reductase